MDQPQVMEILAKILDSQKELRKNQEFTNQEVKAMNQKMNALQAKKKALIDTVIQPGETMLSKLSELELRELFDLT